MKSLILLLFSFFPLIFPGESEEKPEWKKHFDEFELKGSFVLYDFNNDKYYKYNSERCSERFIPASTFKIMNTLIGLETGVIKDENFSLKWDGVKRDIESHNRDHNLRSAFKYSVVWFYQEVARRIGEKKMQYYIDLTNYGNKDISGGIDLFWLQGGLRISQNEQIEFLKKIYKDDLPFSKRSISILKDIMIMEKTDNYTLRAKTGWAMRAKKNIGWYVGYLEQKGNIYFFALNIESEKPAEKFANARIEISRKILKEFDLL
jgi:beta-lactamase class D